jgi:hypothetical protein
MRRLRETPGSPCCTAILRLPGEDRMDEATRLATEDDVSVASGFFTVEVRSWRVIMHS